jgi:hypothetical protein
MKHSTASSNSIVPESVYYSEPDIFVENDFKQPLFRRLWSIQTVILLIFMVVAITGGVIWAFNAKLSQEGVRSVSNQLKSIVNQSTSNGVIRFLDDSVASIKLLYSD